MGRRGVIEYVRGWGGGGRDTEYVRGCGGGGGILSTSSEGGEEGGEGY